MKTANVVVIVILVLLVAAGIFLVMNRPANLLIRKTFSFLTGYEIVSTKEYSAVKSKAEALELKVAESDARAQEYKRIASEGLKRASEAEDRAEMIERDYMSYLSKEKERADSIKYLPPIDQAVLFDNTTTGGQKSLVIQHEGQEMILTGVDRITSANQQIAENDRLNMELAYMSQILKETRDANNNYRNVVIPANERHINELTDQLNIKDDQIEMWKNSHSQAMAKGKRWMMTGIGVTALNVLLIIIL